MITRRRLVYFLVFCFVMICAAPYLINLKPFRDRIERTIHDQLGIDAAIGRLAWHWFPVPGLLLQDTTLRHPAFNLSVSRTLIHPSLSELVTGTLSVQSIRLVEPHLKLTSPQAMGTLLRQDKNGGTASGPFPFDHVMLSIDEGRVSGLFSESGMPPEHKAASPDFSHISLTVLTTPTHLTVHGRLRSSFMEAGRLTLDLWKKEPAGLKWDLRVKANNLDYTPVRSRLIRTFPENEVLMDICRDMIREGRITQGTFQFNGTTAQWSDINRMKASAQVDKVRFHIPGSSLVLEQTGGALTLDHGTLSGQAMSAILGASRGRKGSFSLGLGLADAMPFDLTISLDADVSDLPPVFESFLPDGQPRQDLLSIRDLKGNAKGKLSLSGDISDLTVGVSVQKMNASGFYPRLGHRINVTGDTLDVDGQVLSWAGLSGDIGPHLIHEASGSLDWEKNLILTLTSMSAGLKSQDLYPRLLADHTLGPRLESRVSSVRGDLDLHEFTFKGPLDTPRDWTCQGRVSSMGLVIESPSIARPVTLISPGIRFTQAGIETRSLTARMGNEKLRLSGSLKNGAILVNLHGAVNSALASWIREKGWLPDGIIPRLPCILDPLTFSLTQETLGVRGLIIHEDGERLPMTTRLDLSVLPEAIHIKRLSVDDGRQSAELTGLIPRDLKSGQMEVSFQGALDGTSLARVLDYEKIPRGTMAGSARLTYPLDKTKKPLLNGDLRISEMKLQDNARRSMSLSFLRLSGLGEAADFTMEDLQVTHPDKTPLNINTLEGTLVFLPGLEADVALSSGTICGLDVSGNLHLPSLAMDIETRTRPDEPLSFKTLTECLGLTGSKISGEMTCSGFLEGTPDMINTGSLSLRAEKGIVSKAIILSKIFALLDLTELFKDDAAHNLLTEGYRFDSIEIDATITNHIMHISRAQIIGAGINFYATGYVGLKNQSLDLYVLASPFKNVDRLVNRIPLIGKKLGGKNQSLLSVPLKVDGHLDDPRTRILPKSVTQASSGILDAFVYTFKLPFKLSSELAQTLDDKKPDTVPEKAHNEKP